jgi:hypothetical protein
MKPAGAVLLTIGGLALGAVLWTAASWGGRGSPSAITVDTPLPGVQASEVAVEPEMPSDRAAPDAPAGVPAAPIAPLLDRTGRPLNISHAHELRSLQEVLAQMEGRSKADSYWKTWSKEELIPVLAAMGVAAPMDAAGTAFQPDPNVWTHTGRRSGDKVYDYAVHYNSRTYRFMKGEFPVYEEYIELRKERGLLERARDPMLPRGPEAPYPEEFVKRLLESGYSALAIRETFAQK